MTPRFPYLGSRLFSKNEEAMSQQVGRAVSAEEDIVSSTSHVVGKMSTPVHHQGLGKSRGPGGASRRKKFLRAGTDACSNLYAYIDMTDGDGGGKKRRRGQEKMKNSRSA